MQEINGTFLLNTLAINDKFIPLSFAAICYLHCYAAFLATIAID